MRDATRVFALARYAWSFDFVSAISLSCGRSTQLLVR